MIDKKSFKKSIAMPLGAARFVRKGQSWYLDGQDAIVVFNLQKSDWADEYFINIGIWLKALGQSRYPSVHDCHLSFRLEGLFREEQKLIREGASLERGDTSAVKDLSNFIASSVVPFLRECTDNRNLRTYMANGRFRSGLIRKDARLALGAEDRIAGE